jgi:hypothetical protein
MITDPPLLPSDDDAGTPLLSSGPVSEEENESSQMMALLMKRPEIEPSLDVTLLLSLDEPRFSLAVVVAATLCLLQCVMIWTSYLSDSWSDTHLLTSIGWQKEYLPFLDNYTDKIIRAIDLGSIFSILRASQDYPLLAIVSVTAVVIPCISIITNPMAVTKKYYSTYTGASHWDLGMRFSFVVIYVLVLLDLSTSVTLEWTDTAIRIHNCVRGSMLCYVLGSLSAIGVVVALRYSHETTAVRATATPQLITRIPPAAAFQHPWPDFVAETYIDDDHDIPETSVRQTRSWYSCFTWQFGIAIGMLLLPSLALPFMEISYTGLAAEFIYDTERKIYLWQLPSLLWNPCDDNKWMVALCEGILVLQTFVLPLLCLTCGLVANRAKSPSRYRKWLSCILPFANSITLASTVVLFVPGLENMTSYLLNEDSSGLCDKVNNTLGEQCLSISGELLPGSWFYLLFSVLLEVFCFLVFADSQTLV